MKAAWLVSLPLAALTTACMVGDAGSGDDGDGEPVPATGELQGPITGDQTWSGPIKLIGNVTIEPGATVTVDAGTALEAKAGVTLRVKGTLRVNGTAAAKVTMLPTMDATTWAGIVADAGATVDLTYTEGSDVATLVYCHAGATCNLDRIDFTGLGQAIVVEGTATLSRSRVSDMVNGGVSVMNGDLTITDSTVLGSSGDTVVQNGGALVIDHSELGEAQGQVDHCVLHIGSAQTLRITRSIIRDGVYGMMLGGTTGAVMQYNNWVGNDPAQDISLVGTNTAADLRYNYWDKGAPDLGAGYDASSPSATRIADAGPRP